MKVNNKQKRHKRHDETMSAVVYIVQYQIYTHIYIYTSVSLPLCMLNLFRLFFSFFWYYCFLIVYTKIFVVYLYKIACTSSNQFTSYCTCVFPPPLLSTLRTRYNLPSFVFPPWFALRFSTFSSTRKTTKSNEQLQILLCTISD